MVKKEFTEERPKTYNDMSDVDLIEFLDTGTLTTAQRDVVRAILDKRTKRSIQDLKETIEKSNNTAIKYNKWLIGLTIAIAVLTLLMLIGLGIQIWLNLK